MKRRPSTSRGQTVGVVLIVISLGAVLLFTASQRAIVNIRLVQSRDNQQLAQNLADTLLARCLGQVVETPTLSSFAPLVNPPGYPPASRADVRCVNNLRGTASVVGYEGRSVPRNVLQLVATASVRGIKQRTEVLFYSPPFPKAVMASGRIQVTRSLRVFGLDPNTPYPTTDGPTALPNAPPHPASICANSDSRSPTEPSIRLGSGSHVTGDVQGSGLVQLLPGVVVGGEVASNQAPQPITDLDIRGLITQAATASGTTEVSGSVGDLEVNFYTGSNTALTVNGDLKLVNDGVLWVNGDLTVNGAIKGRGLVLVDGNTVVHGGSELTAQYLVALASTGNVTLVATDRAQYSFQGLVYCEKDLSAANITVLGTVLVNGPPGHGNLDLDNVDIAGANVAATQHFGKWIPGYKYKFLSGYKITDQMNMALRPALGTDPDTPSRDARYDLIYTDKPKNPNKSFIFRNRTVPELKDLHSREATPRKLWKDTLTEGSWLEDPPPNGMIDDDQHTFFPYQGLGAVRTVERGTGAPSLPGKVKDWGLDINLTSRLSTNSDRMRVLLWRHL